MNRSTVSNLLHALLVLGCCCAVFSQAAAQGIDEIIVSAQRRDRPVQDVPISVAVFDQERLDASGWRNISEIALFTPNLDWDRSNIGTTNASSIFIRGVGQAANFAEHSTDPGVGVYQDGVYIGRFVGSALGLLDIRQVEVLRGPQGTLFGKNTTGGAVTAVSNRPTANLAGWIDATVGADSRQDLRGVLNLPLSDRVWTRIAASGLNQDGYGTSLQDGTDYGDIDTDQVRATLRWLASDAVTVDVVADWARTRESSPAITLAFANADPMSLTGAYNFFVAPSNSVPGFGDGVPWDDRFMTPGEFTNYSSGRTGSELDTDGLTAIVDWRPGELTLVSTTALRTTDSYWASDVDLSPMTIIEDIIVLEQEQFSQEINLHGQHGKANWLVGVYYFDEEATASGGPIIVPELATVEFDPVFGVPNPLFGVPLSVVTDPVNLPVLNTHESRSLAAYGHVDFAFTGRFSGFAGARYTHEERTVTSAPGLTIVASEGDSRSVDDFSPTLGIQFTPDVGTHYYASVSHGFKSGGFNTLVAIPRANYLPYDSEDVSSYEIGVKLSRDRFVAAVSAFHADYENIQLPVINQVEPQIINAAEARLRGGEAETTIAITGAFTLQAGIGYLDAEYTRLDDDDLQGLIVPITLDSKFINAPQWSANLSLVYSTPLGQLGDLSIRGDYSWRDRTYKDAVNTPEIVQEAHGILNAAASLTRQNMRWQVTLFGDNITDEAHIQSGGANKPDFGLAWANYARPRTWGLRVQYRFGRLDAP